MTDLSMTPVDHLNSEFTISRTFNAPRELVFKAWTEPQRLADWWGPAGCTLRVHQLDLRPGGIFLYAMEMPGGMSMWGRFLYREISAPERLVFVSSFSDEAGNVIRSPFSETWPLETLSTLEWIEQDGKTLMKMTGVPLNATEAEQKTFRDGHASMQQGWGGTLEKLETYLANA